MTRGYYAIVRYMADVARGEPRNLAVMLLDVDGQYRGMRSLRPGSLSRNVEEHGIVARVLESMNIRFSGVNSLENMRELVEVTSGHSIYVTEPIPVLARQPADSVLDGLYAILVAPRSHPAVGFTKGHILDRLSRWAKTRDGRLEIGAHHDGYPFDGLLRQHAEVLCAMHVISFAARNIDQRRLEQDAAGFLFASPRISAQGVGVIQAAPSTATEAIRELEDKVVGWFNDAGVITTSPAGLRNRYLVSPTEGSGQLQLLPVS